MAEESGISPVVQQSMEAMSAAAAQKQVAVGAYTAAGGGAWATLGANAPQLGIIIAIIGLFWSFLNNRRQNRAMQRLEEKYEAKLKEMGERAASSSAE